MRNYLPLGYENLNLIEGTYSPSTAKYYDNDAFKYWVRTLFQRVQSVLIFDFPDNWSAETRDFFYYCILKFGFVACFDSKEYGFSFQPCTLYGYNFYYQPTNALITNPAITGSLDLVIHEQCELIKLTPDYFGIWDIIEYYAIKLAEISCASDMSIENSKLAYVLAGKTKSAIASLKKIFDKISKGETCVVSDARVMTEQDVEPYHFLTRDVKNSYITTDLLQNTQTLLDMFDCEIGIPTVPYQKKERMVDFEAKSRLIDATSRLTLWIETLDASIDNVNAMFGTSISVKARYDVNELAIAGAGGEGNE